MSRYARLLVGGLLFFVAAAAGAQDYDNRLAYLGARDDYQAVRRVFFRSLPEEQTGLRAREVVRNAATYIAAHARLLEQYSLDAHSELVREQIDLRLGLGASRRYRDLAAQTDKEDVVLVEHAGNIKHVWAGHKSDLLIAYELVAVDALFASIDALRERALSCSEE